MNEVGTFLVSLQGEERVRFFSIQDEKVYAFAFAVSTLASSERSDSPSAERSTFPLDLAEPKSVKNKCGPPFGALSGKRGQVL